MKPKLKHAHFAKLKKGSGTTSDGVVIGPDLGGHTVKVVSKSGGKEWTGRTEAKEVVPEVWKVSVSRSNFQAAEDAEGPRGPIDIVVTVTNPGAPTQPSDPVTVSAEEIP